MISSFFEFLKTLPESEEFSYKLKVGALAEATITHKIHEGMLSIVGSATFSIMNKTLIKQTARTVLNVGSPGFVSHEQHDEIKDRKKKWAIESGAIICEVQENNQSRKEKLKEPTIFTVDVLSAFYLIRFAGVKRLENIKFGLLGRHNQPIVDLALDHSGDEKIMLNIDDVSGVEEGVVNTFLNPATSIHTDSKGVLSQVIIKVPYFPMKLNITREK